MPGPGGADPGQKEPSGASGTLTRHPGDTKATVSAAGDPVGMGRSREALWAKTGPCGLCPHTRHRAWLEGSAVPCLSPMALACPELQPREDRRRASAAGAGTWQHHQPRRVMGKPDRIARQTRVLPRVLKGDIAQGQNL